RFLQSLTDGRPDFSASDSMFDPKLPDPLVAMGQGETVRRLGVAEKRGVEIHSQPVLFCPCDPTLAMFGREVFAVAPSAAGLRVRGVKAQPMFAGYDGK